MTGRTHRPHPTDCRTEHRTGPQTASESARETRGATDSREPHQ